MILIITNKKDGHIGYVTKYLDDHKTYGYAQGKNGVKHKAFEVPQPIKWVSINIEDFATNLKITIRPNNEESFIEIIDSKKKFKIKEIKGVWYRKPDPVNLSHFKMEQAKQERLFILMIEHHLQLEVFIKSIRKRLS